MKTKGFENGLPFIAHMGMWGDFFIVSPLIALIVSKYSSQWNSSKIFTAFVIGTVVSLAMHQFYKTATLPESHTYGGRLTATAWVHIIYMALALVGSILFYFFTRSVPSAFAITVSLALGIHIFFGTHCVLGMWNPSWYGGQPLRSIGTWATLIPVWILLGIGCKILINKP